MSVNRFMVPPCYDNDRFETLRLLLVDGALPQIRPGFAGVTLVMAWRVAPSMRPVRKHIIS